MAVRGAKWRFPNGDYGEIKGINDAGVETFNKNSLQSLVRECIQNSLDAATGQRVFVEFAESDVKVSDIPGSADLRAEFDRCLRTGGDRGRTAQRFLKRGLEILKGSSVHVLRVSDNGTTGLTGAFKGGTDTDWSRLVKMSGSSDKQNTSGGSFGIGKYATFSCSEIRTVFFSSLDTDKQESNIGVSRLISSQVSRQGDLYTTGIGYYSDTERNGAIRGQLSFPGLKPRNAYRPGTDILVMGFMHFDNSTREIVKYVLVNFLVSIWRAKLTVTVNGETINDKNLGKYVAGLNSYEREPEVLETIEHYDLLTSTDPSVKRIVFDPADIATKRIIKPFGWEQGEATLYIKSGPASLNRAVMMTRNAGMRLFNQKNISSTIHFTGILMIEGDNMNRDFKEMEVPSHDKWAPERTDRPSEAKQRLQTLRRWVKSKVTEAYKQKEGDEVEAYGTALYLPRYVEQETGEGETEEETVTSSITEVRQKDTTPQRTTVPESPTTSPGEDAGRSHGQSLSAWEQVDVTFDDEGDAIRKGEGPSTGDGDEPIRGSGPGDDPGFAPKAGEDDEPDPQPQPDPEPRFRTVSVRTRLMCLDRDEKRYQVSFVVPRDAREARVELSAAGEIGTERMGIAEAQATVGGRECGHVDGTSVVLDGVRKGDPARIEFRLAFNHYCMMEVTYRESF